MKRELNVLLPCRALHWVSCVWLKNRGWENGVPGFPLFHWGCVVLSLRFYSRRPQEYRARLENAVLSKETVTPWRLAVCFMNSVFPVALLHKGCKMKVRAKRYESGWASGHMAREGFPKEGTKQSYQEETECAQEA